MRGLESSAVPGGQRQNDDGYREFFLGCRNKVLWAVSTRTTDGRFIEDAVQEAFILARHQWDQIKDFDMPEMWVIKVAWHKVLRSQRQVRNQEPIGEHPVAEVEPVDVLGQALLRDAIRTLPRRQSEAITLRVAGYSMADIAQARCFATSGRQ